MVNRISKRIYSNIQLPGVEALNTGHQCERFPFFMLIYGNTMDGIRLLLAYNVAIRGLPCVWYVHVKYLRTEKVCGDILRLNIPVAKW